MTESLLLRVLSAMIREDVVGLRSRGTVEERSDGLWLRLAASDDSGDSDESGLAAGSAILIPVRLDGFQCEFAARQPVLRVEPDGRELRDGDGILRTLARFADPEDHDGFVRFGGEYRDAVAGLRLQAAARDRVVASLASQYGDDCARWRGPSASLAFDTLAAHVGHPLYPTSAARPGLSREDLHRYAPEFAPDFALRWLAVPESAVRVQGPDIRDWLDGAWPNPSELGLAGLDASHVTLPVHPLTAAGPLLDVLRATGLEGRAVLADQHHLQVAATLSMRTVAPNKHPDTHLKLPLATSTLGLLNRRSIKPGSLIDGAATQRLLDTVLTREPRFQDGILHADETQYAHAGHELLAVLARRLPAGLDRCTVLPLAALPATAPDGRAVIDHLADRWFAGDPLALLDAVLTLLLDWQTTLLRYGIALESHQQNISLVLDDDGHIRLLFKDDDGPRIHLARLRDALEIGRAHV